MKKHPNILFFGIDSLRSDHMSLYGYKRLTTPHIDAFIEDGGITFDKMYSPSIPTTPGYASMLIRAVLPKPFAQCPRFSATTATPQPT